MISQDHNNKILIDNGTTIDLEGTYEITATDEAGNTTTVWVAVDKTAPTTKEYAGKYTLTYNTKDAAGNVATELVVYVEVIENDYVITFVDVDNNNFTYTYGDTISNFKVKIYSDITEDYVTYDESDITYEIVGGTTITNAGTYTVKATSNATKFPNTEVAEQVITVNQKEVELEFVKTNGTTTVNEYEFDGQTNPFTVTITTQLVGEDVVTPTVTYSTSTFGLGEHVLQHH